MGYVLAAGLVVAIVVIGSRVTPRFLRDGWRVRLFRALRPVVLLAAVAGAIGLIYFAASAP